MAGGIYGKELEEVLMRFTAKGTEQNNGAHKQNVDMETDHSSAKEHAGKPTTEAQTLGKFNIAQMNVRNEVPKGNKDPSASKKGTSSVRECGEGLMKSIAKSVGLVEQTKEAPGNAGDGVDIIGGPKTPGYRLIEAEPNETTESSSSFGATDDSGDELSDILGDSEATSSRRGNVELYGAEFNRFGELSRMRMKRKKVSSQWKSRIQPLAWRLKWAELHMKMLDVLAEGYDRKLEDCNKLKQIRLERSQSQGCGSARQIPFSHVKDANHVLRRKKRKRAESSGDLTKYMLQHNLFSYYNNGRKNVPSGQVTAPKFIKEDESWASSEKLLKEFQHSGNSAEDKLQMIFNLASKSMEMKSRAKKILDDSSWMSFGAPSSIGTYITAQLISEYSQNDNLAPEDEAEVHENMVPGIRNKARPNGGDLMSRQGVIEEGDTSEDVQAHRTNRVLRPLVIRDRSVNLNSSLTQIENDANLDDQPSKKAQSVAKLTGPRSKRTRGRRSSKRGGK